MGTNHSFVQRRFRSDKQNKLCLIPLLFPRPSLENAFSSEDPFVLAGRLPWPTRLRTFGRLMQAIVFLNLTIRRV